MTDGTRSFASYFDEHYPPLFRLLCVALRDRGLAEEAAQHALSGASDRWGRTGRLAPTGSQLYAEASRHAIRHVDAASPSREWVSEPDTLARAIEELPIRERLALVLHHRAGLTRDELGRAMRCRPDRASSTLRESHRRIGIVNDDDDDIPEVDFDEL